MHVRNVSKERYAYVNVSLCVRSVFSWLKYLIGLKYHIVRLSYLKIKTHYKNV